MKQEKRDGMEGERLDDGRNGGVGRVRRDSNGENMGLESVIWSGRDRQKKRVSGRGWVHERMCSVLVRLRWGINGII